MINDIEFQKLKKQYPDFFKQFPQELLEFIFSEETSFKIAEICLKNGIEDEEKIEKIAYRVGLALLNQVPKENLAEILEKGVDLNPETAKKVSTEIKQCIFSQIPEILKRKKNQVSLPYFLQANQRRTYWSDLWMKILRWWGFADYCEETSWKIKKEYFRL